jgi:hypothetical protein
MTKGHALSDFALKTAYVSVALAAVFFVCLLLLTGLHP